MSEDFDKVTFSIPYIGVIVIVLALVLIAFVIAPYLSNNGLLTLSNQETQKISENSENSKNEENTSNFEITDANVELSLPEIQIIQLVNANCTACNTAGGILNVINNLPIYGLKIVDNRLLNMSDPVAQSLISNFNIQNLPAFIVTTNDKFPEDLLNDWNIIGTIESENTLVARNSTPPYFEIESNSVRGLFDLVVVQDSSCWACFNAKDLVNGLGSNLGMTFSNIQVFDANSQTGAQIIGQFNFQYLPAGVIVGDTSVYGNFEDVWSQIGRIDENFYILDNNSTLGQGYYVSTADFLSTQ